MTGQEPLPARTVRLTRLAQGIELYFPPLRTPGAALGLALFGVACFLPGLFAANLLAPLAESGPAGVMALWLMSIFVLPFLVFGAIFPLLAIYVLANSLTVRVTESEIRSRRRIFGIPLREQRIATADVTALDAVAEMRYRWPRQETAYLSLVARTRGGAGRAGMEEAPAAGQLDERRGRRVKVAEAVRGEALLERVTAEIVRAGRLERLNTMTGTGDR